MRRTPRGKDRPHAAARFAVRFVGGVGWQVQQGNNWRHAREVSLLAPVITSPSGVLYGDGVVSRKGGVIVITA